MPLYSNDFNHFNFQSIQVMRNEGLLIFLLKKENNTFNKKREDFDGKEFIC
jgi:hypothetical protein